MTSEVRAAHASDELSARYPGRDLTDEQKNAVRDATASIEQLVETEGLLTFAVGEALSSFVTGILESVAEIAGEEAAIAAAVQVGHRYGRENYSKYLRNRGLTSSPEVFCAYQDYMHAVRGPRHATALWATYGDDSVTVERSDCLYFSGERGTPNRIVAAMEASIVEGYQQVDPQLRMENPRCLTKGNPEGCLHLFRFSQPAE
ncbi:hypothetical protein [Amycolatopsis pithecellobii]|uniref:L-2-amino-thiazoline-4-carboxylic acid hydrolase n=1 Tax=Amycolatopsis pithecellobii TaxID=664692 RepID=A0A6N7YPT8_9PSEU|nr:hypothetical protein [Amycolatopsis pithecellobii]MTD54012.1 hypothetical protein [Amycolatopsis pithecellobii]